MTRSHRFAIAVAALALVGPTLAQTWNTTAPNGNWSVATNWSPVGVPVSSNTTVLTFGASTITTTLGNDIAGGLIVNRINFTAAAPAYNILSIQPVDFRRTPGFTPPRIAFDATTLVNFNTPTTLTHDFFVTGTGTGTLLLAGQISGAGSLTMTGAGTLQLGSGSNSFGGGVVVSSGTVELTNGTAVPAASNVTIDGGQFNIGSLSNAAASALGTVTVNSGGTFRVPSGTGNYHITNLAMGGGTVDLTNAVSFDLHLASASTGITVSANSTWTGASVSFNSRLVNDTATALPITLSSGAVLSSTIRLANGASGQGFRVTGSGIFNLNNTAGNTADLIVDGTTALVTVSDMAALGSGSLTLMNRGTLRYTGPTATSAKAITLGSNNGGDINIMPPGTNLTLTGVIGQSSAGQDLRAIGGGVLTLAGSNTFTGSLSVVGSGGTVSVATLNNGGVSGPLGASTSAPANLVLGSSFGDIGTLQYTGATATTNRGFTVGNPDSGGTIDVTNAGTALTFTGQATGVGRLVKFGAGTLVLSNTTNNYAAGTFVNGGTLMVGAFGAVIPAGSNVTVAAGAVFDTGGFNNGSTAPIGTVTLNGGGLQGIGANIFFINRLVTDGSGGSVNFGVSNYVLRFTGTGAGIAINGNSLWTGGLSATLGGFRNELATELDLAIAPGVTVTSEILLGNGTSSKGYRLTGGGTLQQNNRVNTADLIIGPARYRVNDVTSNSGNGLITTGALTFDGGTLEYTGSNASLSKPFTLGLGGGTLNVTNAATTLDLTGPVSGEGRLVKAGPGVLTLNNASNFFVGGITVNGGRLDVSADSQLGGGEIVVNASGTLRYTSNISTSRTLFLNGGTLEAPSGMTLNGATVNGGFLRGAGTFTVTGGTALNGASTATSTTVSQTGAATVTNFTNNGQFTNPAGHTLTWSNGTNTSAGRLTVNGTANVSDFVSNGDLRVSPTTTTGVINNVGGGTMTLGGGSTTFIGTQANRFGTINLNGGTLEVRGGLLVNAGPTTPTGGVLNGTTLVNFGSLAKGNGYYDDPISINGGVISGGFSPGVLNVGTYNVNGGGGSFAFEITDPGPSATFPAAPGTPGTNPGWDTVAATTRIRFTATPADKYTIVLTTQLPLPSVDQSGPMANFDPNRAYSWLFVSNPSGSVVDLANAPVTFDPNAITLATVGSFINPTAGAFSIRITADNRQVFIDYTPVPEPTHLLAFACGAWVALRVRKSFRPVAARNRPMQPPGHPE